MFYFSACPWNSGIHNPGSAEDHIHTSAKPPQHHLPSKSLCFLGSLPMMWVLLSLSPCSRGALVWHEREVTFMSIREKQVIFVQQLLQLEDSPSLSLFCPSAMWKWMGNPHRAPALVLFCLACYFNFLLLSAALHQEHRVQQGIKHGLMDIPLHE